MVPVSALLSVEVTFSPTGLGASVVTVTVGDVALSETGAAAVQVRVGPGAESRVRSICGF